MRRYHLLFITLLIPCFSSLFGMLPNTQEEHGLAFPLLCCCALFHGGLAYGAWIAPNSALPGNYIIGGALAVESAVLTYQGMQEGKLCIHHLLRRRRPQPPALQQQSIVSRVIVAPSFYKNPWDKQHSD